MPRPSTPAEVDGTALDTQASATLARLIDLIWAADPTRPADQIQVHAISAFLRVYEVVGGGWVPRSMIQLGTSSADPVVPNPDAFDASI